MSAQEIAQAIVSGNGRLILGAVLFLALLALRRLPALKRLLDPVTLRREAVALAGLVLPVVIATLASGAAWTEVAVAAITAVGIALGLQSRPKPTDSDVPKAGKARMSSKLGLLSLALLFVAGCGALSAGQDAHQATLDMLREDLDAHEAMAECVEMLDAGASEGELLACVAAAADRVRAAADATRCQVEAVDSLIEAVEGDAGAGGGL